MSTHPLDPLTPEELGRAVATVRAERALGKRVRFIRVDLEEPDKADLAGSPPRRALVVVLDNDCPRGIRVHRRPRPRADRPLDEAGRRAAGDLGRRVRRGGGGRDAADPGVPRGARPSRHHRRRDRHGAHRAVVGRLVRDVRPPAGAGALAGCARRTTTSTRTRGRSAGLVAVVDLHEMEVRAGRRPRRRAGGGRRAADYRDGAGEPYRADLRPLEIVQPEGPSFTLDGSELRWQKWRMRIGFANREGLVLHQIGYEDDGELRSVCHRASIAELVIPYGDPSPTMHFKNVFDIGEYGLGPLVNALELGCDCLGEIRYLDSAFADTQGRGAGAAQRDLHPRGGLRAPLEAPRRPHRPPRRRPLAAARGVVRGDGRQLRVRLLLATSTRTARSASRAS